MVISRCVEGCGNEAESERHPAPFVLLLLCLTPRVTV